MGRNWTIGIFLFAIIAALTAWRLWAADRAADAEPTGTLTVRVVDGMTLLPLSGASVIIPEADTRAVTGRDGATEPLAVPVRPDARFETVQAMPWGEVTVLVYASGYYPYALFHCNVREGLDRDGPSIYLFPDDGSLAEPFAVIESPDPAWVQSLLERYAPGRS